mmetsp:Transcript_13222/g.31066  ORF Transcript_13222/g.31066 Transcript_13222/m.31066 type:complete len:217 (-) Transcript_13222:4-654(-)
MLRVSRGGAHVVNHSVSDVPVENVRIWSQRQRARGSHIPQVVAIEEDERANEAAKWFSHKGCERPGERRAGPQTVSAGERSRQVVVRIERARDEREQLGREVVEQRRGRALEMAATCRAAVAPSEQARAGERVEASVGESQPPFDQPPLLRHHAEQRAYLEKQAQTPLAPDDRVGGRGAVAAARALATHSPRPTRRRPRRYAESGRTTAPDPSCSR